MASFQCGRLLLKTDVILEEVLGSRKLLSFRE